MDRCVIFCAGGFDTLAAPIRQTDYILAADGGLSHLRRLGIQPHAILGDFDSLGHIPAGAQVFPVEKDDTDSMLAVRHGLDRGYRQFLLYGALDGPRLDHTIANLQTLQFLADRGATGYLVGEDTIATVIRHGQIHFPDTMVGTISVFCMGSDATGVTIRGLKYGLEEGTLTAGYPLGVSNSFVGKAAQIRVAQGSLLILWSRDCGLPEVVPC